MKPKQVVDTMLERDWFSRWLGINVLELKEGHCKLGMRVNEQMLNGFGIAHGGITYALADSALAFASNSWGRKSLSIHTSISHLVAVQLYDELEAVADCEQQSEKLGHYKVRVYLKNDPSNPVALFNGTVYRTSANWE